MPLTLNDIELIAAFNKGEQSAYTVIYDRFRNAICYFIEQLVNDRTTAEDLTAEAFIKTFRKNTDFDSLDKVKAYLYISANNAALDHIKMQKRHAAAHEQIRYLGENKMDDSELAYIKAEAIRAIHRAINNLPPQQQQVIKLTFIEGKTLQEVADTMHISYNTVQNHRAKGLQLLRGALVKNKLLTPLALLIALALLDNN